MSDTSETIINENNVVDTIHTAVARFNGALTGLYESIQTLYAVYLTAKDNTQVADAIEKAYGELTNAPKTKRLTNRIAFLAFSTQKQRVSEIHKILVAAEEAGVAASGFVAWVKDRGGLAVSYRSTSDDNSSGRGNGEVRIPDFYKVTKVLAQHASTNTPLITYPAPFGISSEELAVQVVQRDANGGYFSFWAKLSAGSYEFVKQTHMSSGSSAPDESNLVPFRGAVQVDPLVQSAELVLEPTSKD